MENGKIINNKIIVLLSLIQILFFCTYVSADIISIGTGGEEISFGYGDQIDLFFAGSDIIIPLVSIISPEDGYKIYDYVSGSIPITVNISASDINLDSCWYAVSGIQTISNTTFNCSEGYNNFDFLVSIFGDFNLTVYVNDSANNQNSSTISFSISVYTGPQQSGGYTIEPTDKVASDFNLYNQTIMCNKVGSFLESHPENYTIEQREYLKNSLSLIFGFGVMDNVLDEYLKNFDHNCQEDIIIPEEPEEIVKKDYTAFCIILFLIIILIVAIILIMRRDKKKRLYAGIFQSMIGKVKNQKSKDLLSKILKRPDRE